VTREGLAALLTRLAPGLDRLAEPWCVFGSAALMMRGLPEDDVPDLDLFTTDPGAAELEAAWAEWRVAGYAPNPNDPFLSRFSRYAPPEGVAEVMGGMRHRIGDVWTPVVVEAVEQVEFAGRAWPVPTVAEHVRVLMLFGRDKDLERAARLQAWMRAG
jgi:hypothetical protein